MIVLKGDMCVCKQGIVCLMRRILSTPFFPALFLRDPFAFFRDYTYLPSEFLAMPPYFPPSFHPWPNFSSEGGAHA